MTVSNTSPHGEGLTADLFARAVIAAARIYGDDPIKAASYVGKAGGPTRRCIAPAASGLLRATGLDPERICAPLGVSHGTVRVARGKARGAFLEAERAAMRAVEFAGWRPEAAASVVAGQQGERPDNASAGERLSGETADAEVLAPCVETAPAPVISDNTIVGKLVALHNRQDQVETPKPAPVERRPTPRPAYVAPATAPGGRAFDFRAPPPPPPTSIEARILDLLKDGSANTQGMATVLDVKENVIGMTLRILLHAGKVTADPIPKEGLRAQRWRLAA